MKVIQTPLGERLYETPYGTFPSVTTILKFTLPEEQKQKLINWSNRKGKKAEIIREKAAMRGVAIHKLIEAKLRGESVQCPDNLLQFWNGVQTTLKMIGKVKAMEEIVYHPQLKYAGRLDLLADWRGDLTICDFKTSHREKRREWLLEAFLQVAAYAGAYEFLYRVPIKQGLIVVISPDNVQTFSLEKEELNDYWEQWVIRLQEYKFNLSQQTS